MTGKTNLSTRSVSENQSGFRPLHFLSKETVSLDIFLTINQIESHKLSKTTQI
ncbi:hypothetical protein H6G36_21745 [Anabaena minutissima FACHB-250]|nr:hypothetical protein [Anabaena minutissima FACHB-250]